MGKVQRIKVLKPKIKEVEEIEKEPIQEENFGDRGDEAEKTDVGLTDERSNEEAGESSRVVDSGAAGFEQAEKPRANTGRVRGDEESSRWNSVYETRASSGSSGAEERESARSSYTSSGGMRERASGETTKSLAQPQNNLVRRGSENAKQIQSSQRISEDGTARKYEMEREKERRRERRRYPWEV